MAEMTRDLLNGFLRETRIAKLAYLQPSGAPTIVPVWYEWDGEAARVFTSRTSRYVKREISRTVSLPASITSSSGFTGRAFQC